MESPLHTRLETPDELNNNKLKQVLTTVVKQFIINKINFRLTKGKGKHAGLVLKENKAVRLPETAIPSPEQALYQYQRSGGKLKTFSSFGEDPLSESPHLQVLREEDFQARCPPFCDVFQSVVTGSNLLLRQTVQTFIEITKRLTSNV